MVDAKEIFIDHIVIGNFACRNSFLAQENMKNNKLPNGTQNFARIIAKSASAIKEVH